MGSVREMLEVQSISIRYGRVTVVRDLSLTDRGSILFDDTSIFGRSPESIARLGISLFLKEDAFFRN